MKSRKKKDAPYGLCYGDRPRILRTPWWETSGRYSSFTCACPTPEGATPRDMITHTETGYQKWRADPNRPPIEELRRENKQHVRKYA